jgi:6-phosphogluconolactonase
MPLIELWVFVGAYPHGCMSNPYDVELPPPIPALPGVVATRPHVDDVIDLLALALTNAAVECARAFGEFHLALSGGSTPMPLYRRLMLDPSYRHLPWDRTHLWIVDERRVPFDDPQSNYRQIHELLVEDSGIPKPQVHPIEAMRPDADRHYENELRQALDWRRSNQDRLDFVVLGMGADGHTASLFPRSRALRDASSPPRDVLINTGPEVTPPERVTMTPHLLNGARQLAVLVCGQGKRQTIAKVSAASRLAPHDIALAADELPILSIQPSAGTLTWYLDHAACPRANT